MTAPPDLAGIRRGDTIQFTHHGDLDGGQVTGVYYLCGTLDALHVNNHHTGFPELDVVVKPAQVVSWQAVAPSRVFRHRRRAA